LSKPQPSRPPVATAPAPRGSWQRGRWKLLLLAAICAAPVIASYVTYYIIKPQGGVTNYGALIEPQRPIPPSLTVRDENNQALSLATLKGKWLMLSVDSSACDEACVKKLYFMRQIRATQSTERERVVTVWLRTDAAPVSDMIRRAYGDTRFLVADPAALAAWLPPGKGTSLNQHIFLVDPNGNLMMRFPNDPDPGKIKNDLTRLLKWSTIG
jgi:cytochrome oxidase Cu insertion factor (SCO1/SenC/PrrC family)